MKKKYESYINEALNDDLKTVEDPELLNMVVAKIIAIHKNDPEYKPSLPDDTAYYIYLVICALSEGGYYRYIETAYSDKTPDAFNEIVPSSFKVITIKSSVKVSAPMNFSPTLISTCTPSFSICILSNL